jgi:ribosomal-protein-alanine N-acetyltransferase
MMRNDRDAPRDRPLPVPEHRIRWASLPALQAPRALLREPGPADIPALLALVNNPDVQQFLPGCPTTSEGLLRYIRWTRRSRRIGQHVSFGVVPHEIGTVAGIFQMWRLESRFQTAEWGFAFGEALWRRGLFTECAEQIVDFAMDQVGVRRLEARVAVHNVRGNAALRKLGAIREGVLRQCFECGGQMQDHFMWALLRDEWHRSRHRPSSEGDGTGLCFPQGPLGDGPTSCP